MKRFLIFITFFLSSLSIYARDKFDTGNVLSCKTTSNTFIDVFKTRRNGFDVKFTTGQPQTDAIAFFHDDAMGDEISQVNETGNYVLSTYDNGDSIYLYIVKDKSSMKTKKVYATFTDAPHGRKKPNSFTLTCKTIFVDNTNHFTSRY